MNTFLSFFALSSRARHAIRRLLVSVLFAVPLCAPTHAQVTPAQERDMAVRHQQELLRQQQQEQQQRQRLEANKPDVRLDAGSPKLESLAGFPVESPCFVIQELRVRDADGRTPNALEWLERDWLRERQNSPVGQCIGAQGVARLLDHGQKVLTERGYVTTRLLVSPQDMSQGILTLTLIPGRIRAVRFDPPLSARSSLDWALPMEPGQLLNLRDIEQALENFKRVPTADADIRIEPAQGPDARVGESDLLVLYRQATPIRLHVSLDDGGTQATGKLLSAATGSLDNLFSANDLFYLTLNTDLGGGYPGPRGSHGKTAHYSLPVGYWTWGVTWSESRYAQQVAGINGDYTYSGTSQNAEIKSSRLLFRDSVQKWFASLTAFQRKSNNYVEDTEVLTQRRVEGGWIAGLNHKTFIGKSTLESNLNYKIGTKAFGALAAPEEHAGWGTSQFKLVTADVNYALPMQTEHQRFRYNTSFKAQAFLTELTPLNRFSIAGRYTVRGFDGENTLTGERGWLWRNDMSWALCGSGAELYYGLDHGEVGGPASDLLVGKTLTGNAVGWLAA